MAPECYLHKIKGVILSYLSFDEPQNTIKANMFSTQ